MQKFVVATDLSERGDRALARGFHLARELGAELVVLTVVDDDLPQPIFEAYLAGAEKRLRETVAASSCAEDVTHHLQVLRGDPAAAIATVTETDRADLLILGIHRVRPFADAVRDTTMQRIMRHVACPVLVACAPAAAAYRGILAAVDFSPASAAALRAAATLAPDAPITAVHALHVPFRGMLPNDPAAPFLREARAAEREWRAAERLPDRLGAIEIEEGSAIETVGRALAKSGADLIAVGAHSRTGLAGRLLGSVATALLRAPVTDILVARPG